MNQLVSPFKIRTQRICVLLNTRSGTADHARVRAALDKAQFAHRAQFELRVLESGRNIQHYVADAVKKDFDTIVAAGGDGTITCVASALEGSGKTMGILPQGTFNYVARGLNIPQDVEGALELILRGNTSDFPLGAVNDQVFLNNASLGLYPAVLEEREGTYQRWGRSRLAAHWSVLRTFARFRNTMKLEITVDGEVHYVRTPLAFVARSAYQLDSFGLRGADAVRNGQLALFVAPDVSRRAMMLRALRLAGNGMQQDRDYTLYCGYDIRIRSKLPERTIAMDGERRQMRGPFRFAVKPGVLRVISPRPAAV